MEIRRLGPGDDALAVSRVYRESWRAAYRGIVPQAFLDEMAEDRWCSFLTGGGAESLLLLDGQRLAGTAACGPVRQAAPQRRGELISLYLLPDYWGRGMGKALLEAALERLREMGCREAALWVLEENRRARAFYERQGFSPTGAALADEIGGRQLRELEYARRLEA